MSYDLIGEIVKYLQIRQQQLSADMVSKKERRRRVIELYQDSNFLKHFLGVILCSLFDFSLKEMSGLERKINRYDLAITDLQENRPRKAMRVLKQLERYFAYVVETEILLKTGPRGTQFEKVRGFIQELAWLQNQTQLNCYELCHRFLSSVGL